VPTEAVAALLLLAAEGSMQSKLDVMFWLLDRDMDGLLGSEDCVKADSGLLAAAHAAAGIVAAVTGGAAAIADLKHNLVAPRRVAAMHDACAVLSAAAYESCNREPNGVTGAQFVELVADLAAESAAAIVQAPGQLATTQDLAPLPAGLAHMLRRYAGEGALQEFLARYKSMSRSARRDSFTMLRHLDSASAEASEEAARSGRLRLQRSSTMPSHRGLSTASGDSAEQAAAAAPQRTSSNSWLFGRSMSGRLNGGLSSAAAAAADTTGHSGARLKAASSADSRDLRAATSNLPSDMTASSNYSDAASTALDGGGDSRAAQGGSPTSTLHPGPFEKTSSENLFASGHYTRSGDVVIEMNGDHGLTRHASWKSKASDSGSGSSSGSGSGRTRGGRRLRRGTKDSAADKRLKELEAAADAATKTMQLEVAADVMPPPATDPKIAVMNLVQALGVRLYVISLLRTLLIFFLITANLFLIALLYYRVNITIEASLAVAVGFNLFLIVVAIVYTITLKVDPKDFDWLQFKSRSRSKGDSSNDAKDDATDRILAAAAAAAPTSLQPVIEAAAARLKKPQTPQTDNEWTSGDSSGSDDGYEESSQDDGDGGRRFQPGVGFTPRRRRGPGVGLPRIGVLRSRRATAPGRSQTPTGPSTKFKDGAQKIWGMVGRVAGFEGQGSGDGTAVSGQGRGGASRTHSEFHASPRARPDDTFGSSVSPLQDSRRMLYRDVLPRPSMGSVTRQGSTGFADIV